MSIYPSSRRPFNAVRISSSHWSMLRIHTMRSFWPSRPEAFNLSRSSFLSRCRAMLPLAKRERRFCLCRSPKCGRSPPRISSSVCSGAASIIESSASLESVTYFSMSLVLAPYSLMKRTGSSCLRSSSATHSTQASLSVALAPKRLRISALSSL